MRYRDTEAKTRGLTGDTALSLADIVIVAMVIARSLGRYRPISSLGVFLPTCCPTALCGFDTTDSSRREIVRRNLLSYDDCFTRVSQNPCWC